MSHSNKSKSINPVSNGDNGYSQLVKNIYRENQRMKEKIKLRYSRATDPILLSNDAEVIQCRKEIKRKNQGELENNIKEGRKKEETTIRKSINSKSVDFLKSSFNIFYSNDNTNKNSEDDFTKSKKSFRKLFNNEKNENYIHNKPPLPKNTKKLYSFWRSRGSLNMGNTLMQSKEHIVNKNGGIMATKKHYSTNSVKPSDDMKRLNDKQQLLPSEFYEKYQKLYNRSGSKNEKSFKEKQIFSANSVIINNDRPLSSNNTKEIEKRKVKYPYVKDQVKEIISTNLGKANKDYSLTAKVNTNPFNILKRVPKFDWEK